MLRKLQMAGVMEVGDITQRTPKEEDLSGLIRPYGQLPERAECDTMVTNLRYGIDTLASYAPKKNMVVELIESLIEGIFGAKESITNEEWEEVGRNLPKYLELCDRCRELENRLSRLKGEKAKLAETRLQMNIIKDLRYPLDRVGVTPMVTISLGAVESKRFEALSSELLKIPEHYLEPVGSVRGQQHLLLIYLRGDEGVIEEILKKHDFMQLPTSGFKGTPAEIIQNIGNRFEEIDLEQDGIKKKLGDLAGQRRMLLVAHDYVDVRRTAADTAQSLGRTDKTFIVEGWVRKADIEELKKTVGEAAVIDRAPLDGEMPPVMLENRPMFRPFQVVTNIYGKPKYAEIDPSAFIAPFFLIFFALCIGDAAYGIVLLTISIVAYYKIPSGRRFFKLMSICSVFTIIFGLLMGGFLGNNFVKIDAVWIDPLANPASFLLIALTLGVVHAVLIGPAIKMYMNIKKKRYADAVFDQMAWMILISSLILFALIMQNLLGTTVVRVFMLDPSASASINEFGASLEPFVIGTAAIAAVMIVLTHNRDQKFGGKRLISGLASLYNVTGYLSDILSYSRILALGMGTAVIAIVVNELAFMALDIQGIGILLAIMVLIIGHTFNIVMGTLGAFVHTARLQFIEFFGKFIEGGGKTFKPFCDRKKYVEIR
ncbi:MAG: V-type ATP synthase subunit I [Candidatus Thermoplasmatota archaeon]|nr:V-type ATP synthase subunit I [Candidatus Thermoplasmatota archaeon]